MIRTSYAIFVSVTSLMIITWYFNNLLDEQYEKYSNLQEDLYECQDNGAIFTTDVTVTMYHATRSQTDSTPNITADGTKINIWKASNYRYVAVSRDLLSRWGGPLNYGDWIVIEGAGKNSGVYQVRDTMNPKWVNVVDILESENVQPYKYTDAQIYKLNWLQKEKELANG